MSDLVTCYLVRLGLGPSALYSERLPALRSLWRTARARAASPAELEACLRGLFPLAPLTESLEALARRLPDLVNFSLDLASGHLVFETAVIDAGAGELAPTVLAALAPEAVESGLALEPELEPEADGGGADQATPGAEEAADQFDEDPSATYIDDEADFTGPDEPGPDEISLAGPRLTPEQLLADLNEAQRAAVRAVRGPVCILAGAGTGKTRVISRRVAYACATGAVDPAQVLVVSFTEKAAREMRERLAALGLAGVAAATFHGAALAQLRLFWERFREGPFPEIVASKVGLLIGLARALPGGYRYLPVADLAAEIEWAKVRRLTPASYARGAVGHRGPLPTDLFARFFANYERHKGEAIDFEDMLGLALAFLEQEPQARALIRERYRWFCVDEYQDTNPLQQALLEAWLDGRDELCVVGDEDQTIYSFAGASSDYLTGFGARYPGAALFALQDNYRSTGAVLEPANHLLERAGRERRLRTTRPPGPPARLLTFASAAGERAGLVSELRQLIGAGIAPGQIAILLRTNAQIPPIEAGLLKARLPFALRGEHFFARFEIKRAIRAIERVGGAKATARSTDLTAKVSAIWTAAFAFDPDAAEANEEAAERQAALLALLAITRELEGARGGASLADFRAEIARRAAAEQQASGSSIELLTYHRAKGLEWDAVLLPSLEEGLLPHRAATGPAATAEERRLLYVGLTRARTHLWASWAQKRETSTGKLGSRKPSRFLAEAFPGPRTRSVHPAERNASAPTSASTSVLTPTLAPGQARSARPAIPAVPSADEPPALDPAGQALAERLRAWRGTRAKRDGVPAYIVITNAALAQIAALRPANLTALAGVSGIGPAKLERYGAEILAIVKSA